MAACNSPSVEEVGQEVYRERGCEHAPPAVPGVVLSCAQEKPRDCRTRANQPGHLAGKVQSHFGGGRGVRGGHEKFILIFHVRVNIHNTVVLSSTVALYEVQFVGVAQRTLRSVRTYMIYFGRCSLQPVW